MVYRFGFLKASQWGRGEDWAPDSVVDNPLELQTPRPEVGSTELDSASNQDRQMAR